jgi:hypothetical protein
MNAKEQLEKAGYPHDFLATHGQNKWRICCGDEYQILGKVSVHANIGTCLTRGSQVTWQEIWSEQPALHHWLWLNPTMNFNDALGMTAWVLHFPKIMIKVGPNFVPTEATGVLLFRYLPDFQDLDALVPLHKARQVRHVA